MYYLILQFYITKFYTLSLQSVLACILIHYILNKLWYGRDGIIVDR